MNLLQIKTNESGKQTVNARELWASLKISTRYNDWILRRLKESYAKSGIDFTILKFEYSDNQLFTSEKSECFLTI